MSAAMKSGESCRRCGERAGSKRIEDREDMHGNNGGGRFKEEGEGGGGGGGGHFLTSEDF